MLKTGLDTKTFAFLHRSYGVATTSYADTGLEVSAAANTTYYLDSTAVVKDVGDGLGFKIIVSGTLASYSFVYEYDGVGQGTIPISTEKTLSSVGYTTVRVWGAFRTTDAVTVKIQAKKLTDLNDPTLLGTGAYLRIVQ